MEIKNMIRYGVVSAVIPERGAARVVFQDRDNLISAELPVLQAACANNQFYSLPDVGAQVLCLMNPNDDNGGGFILGSFYSEKNPPPAQIQDVSLIKFADGSYLKFDRATGNLDINCKGNITIKGKRIDLNP